MFILLMLTPVSEMGMIRVCNNRSEEVTIKINDQHVTIPADTIKLIYVPSGEFSYAVDGVKKKGTIDPNKIVQIPIPKAESPVKREGLFSALVPGKIEIRQAIPFPVPTTKAKPKPEKPVRKEVWADCYKEGYSLLGYPSGRYIQSDIGRSTQITILTPPKAELWANGTLVGKDVDEIVLNINPLPPGFYWYRLEIRHKGKVHKWEMEFFPGKTYRVDKRQWK